nr:MAG TPA: hypothetical protein [Caudoviricetes sp.]
MLFFYRNFLHNVPMSCIFAPDACEVASHGPIRNNKIKGSVGASWQALFINLTGCEGAP